MNSLMKRTGGVITSILTSIFLGIPGFIPALLGFVAAIGTQIPEVVSGSVYTNQEVQAGSTVFLNELKKPIQMPSK